MPKIFSIGHIIGSKNPNSSYVAKCAAVSACLGAGVQGIYDLGYYVKNSNALKNSGSADVFLKTIPKSVAYSAGCSALLGAVLSGAYILIDKIKNSKKNDNKTN